MKNSVSYTIPKIMEKFLKNTLKSISVLSPNAYAFYEVTSDDTLNIDEKLVKWFEAEGLEFFVFFDLGKGFRYDIHYYLKSENKVNSYCESNYEFFECLQAGIVECFKLLDSKYSSKQDYPETYLDAITVGAVKRQKRQEFFKSDQGKKILKKKRNKSNDE
tara:strand:+ start:1245 stop:1727 length:483 start_codon:yes stop_codon:yes gene_type:complete